MDGAETAKEMARDRCLMVGLARGDGEVCVLILFDWGVQLLQGQPEVEQMTEFGFNALV